MSKDSPDFYGEYAYGTSLSTVVEDLGKRVEILESKIEALPAILAESLISSLEEAAQDAPDVEGVPVDESGCTLRDQYGQEAKPSVQVRTRQLLMDFAWTVDVKLRDKVNFDELLDLRKRIRVLEEDLGYRRKVVERLMEEPAGNRRI